MTTPSSSSLSHALNPPTVAQKPQTDLPRLQLAPPEHQKHLQTQAQARQQQETRPQTPSISPAQRRPDEHAASPSSSREISPAIGVENTQPTTAEKRKASASRTSASKKRRTDQVVEEEARDVPLQYGLGTHYPYAYAYPGAPAPPPPTFHQAPPTNPSAEMGFNEFHWRLLNLCGEFYEAATELIRATPHLVLSQAFQLLSRGAGLDPISVLNDARRTCDILLANPQAFATAPPLPTALPSSVLSSLAHLNSRASVSAAPTTSVAPPSYHPSLSQDTSGDKSSQKLKEKEKETERQSNNVQGTWKDHEVQKLKMLAEKYRVRDKGAAAQEEEEEEEEDAEGIPDVEGNTRPLKKTKELGNIDWDKVVAEFGDDRSRHQVLIKATYLRLKPSSTLPGKKLKKKKHPVTSTEPPPPTFSSASVKSIPVGYPSSQVGAIQSPSASPGGPTGPGSVTAPRPPTVASTSNNAPADTHKPPVPPPPVPQPQHTPGHPHAQYPQTGWYPHPQNPYYAYHQPMYYSAHPPSYGLQSYVHTPPQQGYYGGQSYAPAPGTEPQQVERQVPGKGKRKESRKSNGPASGSAATSTHIPPPSLPSRAALDSSSVKLPITVGGPSATDAQGSGGSTPRIAPAVPPGSINATPKSSSGVLRRGPNNSLFTYTPLPHGGGGTSTEQHK